MSARTFNLNIQGYWRDKNKVGIPNHCGIYLVYETFYNSETDTVTVINIIFIGNAEHVRDAIVQSQILEKWKSYIKEGNELSYCTAFLEKESFDQVTSALVYYLKPKDNPPITLFIYDQTTIISAGKTILIDNVFTVP
jgi:hypothetical protein